MLIMEDEKGIDNKIITVPASKINPYYAHIDDISQLSEHERNCVKEFFEIYKRMEPNKWVKVKEFVGRKEAGKEVEKTINNYNNK